MFIDLVKVKCSVTENVIGIYRLFVIGLLFIFFFPDSAIQLCSLVNFSSKVTASADESITFIGFPKNGMITYAGTSVWFMRTKDALSLVSGLVLRTKYFCPLRLMGKAREA